MEEKEKNGGSLRKKAIKRFAVIFTVILLLLTFFSNTIMNYSLPEVSTTTVSGASVQQKIRCEGEVEACKDKEINVSGESVVKEVLVESGDHVKKGDVLVTFDEEENTDLKKAEDDLKDMERDQAKNELELPKDYTDTLIGIENDRLRITVTQIAGILARRIVSWVTLDDVLEKGERYGLIRFGSCTEVVMPKSVEVLVKKGDRVKGGETIIGRVRSDDV